MERFAESLALIDSLQTSCWFALPQASYFPAGKEALVLRATVEKAVELSFRLVAVLTVRRQIS